MTRTQFNELYTGIALIINDTVPANATILTENEMKDTKAMYYTIRTVAWRWHPGQWKTYTTITIKKIPYLVPILSYHHGVTISTPWGKKEIGGFWYPSGYTTRYYTVNYPIKISYYVPGYPEPYAVYKREAEPEDIDYVTYYSNLFTVSGGAGLLSKVITAKRAGKVVLTTKTVFDAGSIGYGIYSMFNYYKPDPNPSGKGEPVVNCIDPSWEPYLAN